MNDQHRIFINYRISDTQDACDRLFSALFKHFGPIIFQDIEIPAGTLWPDSIRGALKQADVVLVLFGQSWLTAEKEGKRRLDEPEDWVRLEIEKAIEWNKTIIPISIGDTKPLDAKDLPESIRALASIQRLQLRRGKDWQMDFQALVNLLEKHPSLNKVDVEQGLNAHHYRLSLCMENQHCKLAFIQWIDPENYDEQKARDMRLEDIKKLWRKTDLLNSLDTVDSLVEAIQKQKNQEKKSDDNSLFYARNTVKRLLTALIPMHPSKITGCHDLYAELEEAKTRQLPINVKIDKDTIVAASAIKFPDVNPALLAENLSLESRVKNIVAEVARVKSWTPSRAAAILKRQAISFQNAYKKQQQMRLPITEEFEAKNRPLYLNLPEGLLTKDLVEELSRKFQANIYQYAKAEIDQDDELLWALIEAFSRLS